MQVRSLQGSGWQKEAQQFQAYGGAVQKYATSQLQGVSRDELSRRDLAPVRMLLRGFLKQAAEEYGDTSLYTERQGTLDRGAAMESNSLVIIGSEGQGSTNGHAQSHKA